MATHAHSTRTPLLPQAGAPSALLARVAGREPGPVTMALRAMQTGIPATERERVRALRKRIADRIEADLMLLDALAGDPDLEPWLATWTHGDNDDREEENEHGSDLDAGEDGDDNGIADRAGEVEQAVRHFALTGEAPFGWASYA